MKWTLRVLKVFSTLVIGLFLSLWLMGETPQSLKHRIHAYRAEKASFRAADAGGDSDWGGL